MGRTLMYASIAALAVFVLSATFVLQHGGESIASVRHVSVHDLTSGPKFFEGNPITTDGVLRFSEEHDRYQLVGGGNFALIIRDYGGDTPLANLLGSIVHVSGKFGIDQVFGVYIDADYVGLVAD